MNVTPPAHEPPDDHAGAHPHIDRLNLALSSARMGTWEWNLMRNLVEWDDQMHLLFGIEPGTFSGHSEDMLQLLDPEDREKTHEAFVAMLKSGAEYDGELRVIWPVDATRHILRIRSKVHFGESGRPQRVIGVCWDITKRRQTEEALERERFLFETLMDHLPDQIYFKDIDSRFITVNRAMATWFGCENPSEMIGKSDADLFAQEHAKTTKGQEQEIMRTDTPLVNVEERETWPDGRETWVSTTKMPLRTEQGELLGTFGLSRDITARKQAEEQLAAFTMELRARNDAIEEDLEMARELQSAMLPQRYPQFASQNAEGASAVRFHHFYHPSMAVGGDFFDILKISDNVAGVLICDVMGHGVRAALVAAILRALVGELRSLWRDPAEFLTAINRAVHESLHGRIPLFASAFYAVADLPAGELRYANAGHPHPLRVDFSDEKPKLFDLNGVKPSPALGLLPEAKYTTSRCSLAQHETILFFTDGLFEVESSEGEVYGHQRLSLAVRQRTELTTIELCDGVVQDAKQFSASHEFTDDVCLVAMEIDRSGMTENPLVKEDFAANNPTIA